jgi:hypothetical protein
VPDVNSVYIARERALVSRVLRTLIAWGTKLPVVRHAATMPTYSVVAILMS